MRIKTKQTIITSIILTLTILTLITGCTTAEKEITTEPEQQKQAAPDLAGNVIEITANGFTPNELTIKKGEQATWINKNTQKHWPASAVHPSHTTYPETGGCIGSKFDACKELNPEETWTFTFDHEGSWNYHDHLNPALRGTINVETSKTP